MADDVRGEMREVVQKQKDAATARARDIGTVQMFHDAGRASATQIHHAGTVHNAHEALTIVMTGGDK